jgi:hypothetical protein
VEPGTSIPDGATGRVGMLVALQRIRDLPEGRLAIVRQPVGWVKELLGAKSPVFAWQVFLTGQPTVIHGRETQEIIVADKCLRPVSQLAQQDMTTMLDKHEQEVVATAVADVRALVSQEAMDSPEFDRALHLAFGDAQLRLAKQVVGVAQVLREAGFWSQHGGDSEVLEWRTAYEGTEISMNAAPGMFGDWRVSACAITERSWHMPELLALNDWPRGKILEIVLELWENVFGRRRVPEQLALGWIYRMHERDMRAIEPVLPHVVMDGVSFRRALRWLREAYQIDDVLVGPPRDLPLAVEIKDAVLRLSTKDYSIGIKLQSGWVDAMRLSLRRLLALPPNAIRGPWARLNWTGDRAWIDGYEICHWSD